ncbi:MAG: hypothetical protein A2Z11_03840 [Candidatus Woykebacteria bacterium RBG_16_43_9]|uniref:histidine kinase n=1 Tax=Candidatus Woykebacteria bacterium RBG_16_43_9 TaxID=1802596 RepID=A0A1G1WDH7_9BACT|nr:MAG: hypothetical protein A2Z11_03840 [Candidatus Woykebacteria bacterium RBG_16_43_9]
MKIRGNPLPFRHSLRVKFSLTTAAIFLVISSLVSFVLIRQNINFQKQSLLARSNTFSNLATKPIGDSYNSYFQAGFLRFREQLIDTLTLNEDVTRLQIISVEGEILFDTINLDRQGEEMVNKIEDPKILQAVFANRSTQLTGKNGDINEIIVPYSDDFGARPFSIRYFISYEAVYKTIDKIILTIGFLTLLVIVITLITMTLLVHFSILNPLSQIVVVAREITHGNLSQKIKLTTRDELEDLASSLNQMIERLKKDIEDLKELDKLKDEFVYLVSHNLRTPVTIIKGYLDSLQKNKSLDKEAVKSVEVISESTKQLEEMTESLINLVSLEKETEVLVKEPTDIKQILEQSVKRFSEKAKEKEINFVFEFPEGNLSKLKVDKQRITQVVDSLIDNAIKFNKEKGRVAIVVEEKKNYLLISIIDTGIGISDEQKPKVFQKLHRATSMLTYNYEGIGLSLYLTKLIIEAHQGQIWFESNLGEGSTFFVKLPITEGNTKGQPHHP